MDRSREVVISGVGVVSPIGIGRDAFWKSLSEGRGGVRPLHSFPAERTPVHFGAELVDFDPKQLVKPRKALKVMCRELQTAFSAYTLATEDAGLEPGQLPAERIGTVFGGEMLYGDTDDFTDLYQACVRDGVFSQADFARHFQTRMYPLWMLKNLPNMAACHVAIAQDAQGPCNTIVSGDASGLLALLEGVRLIDRGCVDLVLVGGTGTRVNLISWVFRGDINQSHRNEDPAGACRPFDAGRDGIVNGEGAAVLVLETRESAERRGARVLARVRGSAQAIDAGNSAATRQAALERLFRETLALSQYEAAGIGHVNTHGLSTVEDDRIEAAAIANVFGATPVTALKSYFGHVGAGCGLLELAGSVLALEHEAIPATLNYTTPDPTCPVQVVHGEPLRNRPASALKVSMSSTGQVAAVIIDR